MHTKGGMVKPTNKDKSLIYRANKIGDGGNYSFAGYLSHSVFQKNNFGKYEHAERRRRDGLWAVLMVVGLGLVFGVYRWVWGG